MCILCKKKKENTKHLFTCPALATDRDNIWKEAKEKTITKFKNLIKKDKDGVTGESTTNKYTEWSIKLKQLIDQ